MFFVALCLLRSYMTSNMYYFHTGMSCNSDPLGSPSTVTKAKCLAQSQA